MSIITSTSTFFSVLMAHFLYANDKLTPRRILGCLGEGFIVIAALLFAVGGVYGKGLSANMDAGVMTGWQLLLGGAMLGLAGFVLGGQLNAFGLEAALLLAYLAGLSAAAFALWSVLLKHNQVGSVSIFICAIPIFGVLLAGLFLGEPIFEWKNLAALVLVSLGIWMVNAMPRTTAFSRSA